jgi:hypothetical protein
MLSTPSDAQHTLALGITRANRARHGRVGWFSGIRPWPAVSREDKLGVLLDIDPLLRRIAVGVGEALGIDVYGADVISSDGTYWLVDVSSFPGFKGVPDAGHLLAERVLAAVRSTKAVA